MRRQFIDWEGTTLSIVKQAQALDLPRSTLYYVPAPLSVIDQTALNAIDEVYTAHPFYGSRRIREELKRTYQMAIGRDHVRRLMQTLGLQAIYPKKSLSQPHPGQPVFPYLLRNVQIIRPNQVWGTDFTYIRLRHGFAYLIAFIDWFSRYVLSWALSPTMEAAVAVAALQEALTHYDRPDMENSDQGSQFTSEEYVELLTSNHIQISMDGRGRCLDNIFTERLWRTVKYEDIYLKRYETIPEARAGLFEYFTFYNTNRVHQSLKYRTPAEVYFKKK